MSYQNPFPFTCECHYGVKTKGGLAAHRKGMLHQTRMMAIQAGQDGLVPIPGQIPKLLRHQIHSLPTGFQPGFERRAGRIIHHNWGPKWVLLAIMDGSKQGPRSKRGGHVDWKTALADLCLACGERVGHDNVSPCQTQKCAADCFKSADYHLVGCPNREALEDAALGYLLQEATS